MRKLKLTLDDLHVSSFETVHAAECRPGTVRANNYNPQVSDGCGTDNPFDSCEYTCGCVSPSGALCPSYNHCA